MNHIVSRTIGRVESSLVWWVIDQTKWHSGSSMRSTTTPGINVKNYQKPLTKLREKARDGLVYVQVVDKVARNPDDEAEIFWEAKDKLNKMVWLREIY